MEKLPFGDIHELGELVGKEHPALGLLIYFHSSGPQERATEGNTDFFTPFCLSSKSAS